MELNLFVLGLVLEVFGVFILTVTIIINPFHGRKEDVMWWNKKRYWGHSWRPFYRNSQTKKLKFYWNHKPIVEGIIPPKYQLEFVGLLFILVGFILQLKFYTG